MSQTFVMKGEPYCPPKRRPGKRCDAGKRRYNTEREAVLAAQKLSGRRQTDATKAMRLYHCPYCHKIHLTSEALASLKIDDAPEFDRHNGDPSDARWIVHQDWFAEWVSQRLQMSDDPTLEAVILSEQLQHLVPALADYLSAEAISTFTPSRFVPNWQNLQALPYGFSSALEEAPQ